MSNHLCGFIRQQAFKIRIYIGILFFVSVFDPESSFKTFSERCHADLRIFRGILMLLLRPAGVL